MFEETYITSKTRQKFVLGESVTAATSDQLDSGVILISSFLPSSATLGPLLKMKLGNLSCASVKSIEFQEIKSCRVFQKMLATSQGPYDIANYQTMIRHHF